MATACGEWLLAGAKWIAGDAPQHRRGALPRVTLLIAVVVLLVYAPALRAKFACTACGWPTTVIAES